MCLQLPGSVDALSVFELQCTLDGCRSGGFDNFDYFTQRNLIYVLLFSTATSFYKYVLNVY